MSSVVLNKVRRGFYLDSVALMRMSRALMALEGVEEAALMMGTPANQEIMDGAYLLDDSGKAAGGGDLIIGIRATTFETANKALAEAKMQLETPLASGGANKTWRPRSLRAAVKASPHANLVLISVPGDFAVAEARKAIRRGLHTMIFSDNVALEAEVDLKREARELGRLVMGPDCGTAIINGKPIAFANVVKRGSIGLVGASGTGTQEVSSLIDQYGGGISHAIGVGGRDLNSEVGGISTLMAIDALSKDPMTKHIVLISKPPPVDVAEKVLNHIGSTQKPTTVCFIGAEELSVPDNVTQVFSLRSAAKAALGLEMDNMSKPGLNIEIPLTRNRIQGLYSGGTLCADAQVVFANAGIPISSNAPIPNVAHLSEVDIKHQLLDMGDDQFTQGRPHPMIDPSVRDDAIVSALCDPETAVLLVDVVIGYGSHNDPAGHLAALVGENSVSNGPAVIASVTGTENDPQVLSSQVAKLRKAQIHVAPTNTDAAESAARAIMSA